MRYKRIIIIAILGFLTIGLTSCSKNNDNLSVESEEEVPSAELIGSWMAKSYASEVSTYSKTTSLPQNEYGYIIKTGGKLTIRSSASFCGTPLTYADFDGTWSLKDRELTINGAYWGGKVVEKWQLIYVSNKTLSIKRISVEFP